MEKVKGKTRSHSFTRNLTMAKKIFKAQLERPPGVGTWTYLTVPFDAAEEFGAKGQTKVRGTINGIAFRGSLLPHGDGRHYLVVKKEIRDQANVTAGSTVRVTLERDTAPRVVAPPKDLQRALARNRAAQAAFAKFSYSHQKEYVEWIESAKKEETRARRIKAVLARIIAGEPVKR